MGVVTYLNNVMLCCISIWFREREIRECQACQIGHAQHGSTR